MASLLLLGLAGSAPGSTQKHAAVLEFELAPGVAGIDRIYFSDRARSALHDSAPEIFVMTRESTELLLQANGKTLADCVGQCEVEIGRKLGADYIISGRIARVGSSIAITMRLLATEDGELVGSSEARGKDADGLQDTMDGALAKLFASLGSSSSTGTVQVEAPIAQPPQPARAAGSLQPGTVDVAVRSAAGEELPGASIAVDGRLAGTSPASLELGPGEHFLEVTKDLYLAARLRLVVKANDVVKASFELKPDFAIVGIASEPAGAAITVDGVPAGHAPLVGLRIRTGQHRVVAELADHVPESFPLVARPGERLEFPLKLTPDFGPLRVSSTPQGAEVFIDGRAVGRTPLALDRVKAGQHVVEIKGAQLSYAPFRSTVVVKRGAATAPIEATLSPREADVVISSVPPGADVWVDGTPRGQTSLKLRLLGGDHQLRTALAGYAPQIQVIHVEPPEPMRVQVPLTRGGTGPGHQFTLADLQLRYRSEPARPELLPTLRQVQERRIDSNAFARGAFGYGGIAGLLAGMVVVSRTCAKATDTSTSIIPGCGDEGDFPLAVGVGVATGLVISVIYYGYTYETAPIVVRDEPDPAALAVNARREQDWQAQRREVAAHNKAVEHQLRAANAAFLDDAQQPKGAGRGDAGSR